MRVLIVNTSEMTGGAAVAAHRLMTALNKSGVKAKMLVRDKQTDNLSVVPLPRQWRARWHFLWERWCVFCHLHFTRRYLFKVDEANVGTDITRLKEFREADIIHLNWVNQGLLSLKDIAKILHSGKPVVWTLHDMWPATGICHVTFDCHRYTAACGHCPYLPSGGSAGDLSHRVWKRKRQALMGQRLHVVTVSTWLKEQVEASSLLQGQPTTVIGNGLSLRDFTLKDREESLATLGLTGKKVIIFGAARIDDRVKGFHFLQEALTLLVDREPQLASRLHLLLFGEIRDSHFLDHLPLPHTWLGRVDASRLPTLYAAASVVVSSSYYETFGQTLIEALACGCVPVTFDNSGQRDIVRHKVNGYLAHYQDTADLAAGIEWALNAPLDRQQLRADVVKRFSEERIAEQYVRLYEQMLQEQSASQPHHNPQTTSQS